MKKILTILFCLTLMILPLGACNGFDDYWEDEEPIPVGGTNLVVWAHNPLVYNYKTILRSNPGDPASNLTKKIIDDFKEVYPDVRVDLSNHGWAQTLNTNILMAMQSTTPVDVLYGETYIQSNINKQYLAELDTDYYTQRIPATTLSYAQRDGKTYGVPVITGSFALIINKEVLKEAGILDAGYAPTAQWAAKQPLAPQYFEDLLEICEAVKSYYTDKGVNDKGGMLLTASPDDSPWRALAVMRAAGGEFLNANGDFNLASPENQKAFAMLRKLVKTSPVNSIYDLETNDQFARFNRNEAAYLIDGIDPITRSVGMPSEGKIVTAEIPVFKGMEKKSNLVVGTVYYSVAQRSEKKDIAEAFIKHLLKPEYQKEYLKTQLRIPTVTEVLESADITGAQYSYPLMQNFLKPFQDESYDFRGGIPSFDKNTANIWGKWEAFIIKVYEDTDTRTLGQLLSDYSSELNIEKDS